jgi:hypothetical protein
MTLSLALVELVADFVNVDCLLYFTYHGFPRNRLGAQNC